MSKLIIYGDIHGCYDEFINLRKKTNPKKNDIEVCVGDIITKGKNSIKIIKYIQEYNIKSVLGNHEDKLLRYLEYQDKDEKNPIILDKDENNIISMLDTKNIDYLKNMPLFLKFKNITILHGGVQNHHDLNNISKKEKFKILKMRYLDNNGNFITDTKDVENLLFWADIYDGSNGFVVYGHKSFDNVRVNKHSLGVDTGCVYGNKLSAVVFENGDTNNYKIESVKSNVCK